MKKEFIRKQKQIVKEQMQSNLPALFRDIQNLKLKYRLIFVVKILFRRYK